MLDLGDGRRLAYDLLGDPGGPAVMMFHGTPGSRLHLGAGDEPARRLGVRLVVPDRPGCGQSTDHPGRTLMSWAADVAALADDLGLGGFVVVGVSGGGPFALAAGHSLPDRVRAVVTVGSPAPPDPSLPPPRVLSRLARRAEWAARLAFALLLYPGRRKPARAVDRLAGAMAPSDRELLTGDTAVRAAFVDDLAHQAPTTARSAARDFALFVRPWDFRLEDLRVPVHVWHGSEDRNVPVAHAAVIAGRCPLGVPHEVAGGGHLLLVTHSNEIFGALA